MKIKFLTLFMLGVLVGCDKGKDEELLGRAQPEILDTSHFDVNGDNKADISFSYHWGIWDGVGASGGFIEMQIHPINGNDILIKKRDGDGVDLALFSRLKDTIFSTVSPPLEWIKRGAMPLNIVGNPDDRWPLEWSVENQVVLNPYYLGVKIAESNDLLIGWLKLEINSRSGKIEILDYRLTSEDYVVIDR